MGKIDPNYTTTVTVRGGREGHAVSDDGALDVQLRRPKLRGANEGTNPEQLFAAAWGGCYQSALGAVARETGDDVSDSTVAVGIGLGQDAEGGFGLTAKITVDIPAIDPERVLQLAEKAHAMCPYSRATQGNIDVEIVTATAAAR